MLLAQDLHQAATVALAPDTAGGGGSSIPTTSLTAMESCQVSILDESTTLEPTAQVQVRQLWPAASAGSDWVCRSCLLERGCCRRTDPVICTKAIVFSSGKLPTPVAPPHAPYPLPLSDPSPPNMLHFAPVSSPPCHGPYFAPPLCLLALC